MQVCKIFAYAVQLINALNCVHCLLLLTIAWWSKVICIAFKVYLMSSCNALGIKLMLCETHFSIQLPPFAPELQMSNATQQITTLRFCYLLCIKLLVFFLYCQLCKYCNCWLTHNEGCFLLWIIFSSKDDQEASAGWHQKMTEFNEFALVHSCWKHKTENETDYKLNIKYARLHTSSCKQLHAKLIVNIYFYAFVSFYSRRCTCIPNQTHGWHF